MKSRVRGQEDVWNDVQFDGIACPPEEDRARQEDLPATDIRYQLSRYGVGRTPTYGVVDFDVGLQEAIASVDAARAAWERLPQSVRDRYKSWPEVEKAAISGELEKVLHPPKEVKEDVPPKEGEKA